MPDNPDVPDVVRQPPLDAIESMRREPGHFSCFGMSCGSTIVVLLVIAAVIYYFVSR